MSSNAYNAQGATLKIGSSGSAKTISAITAANPPVITASAHGFTEGQVVKITSVSGMTEINSKVGIVKDPTTNTFKLAGVDATSFTAYTSGGSATPTQATVGQFRSWDGPDAQSSDVDVSDLSSAAKEFRAGLMDYGSLTLQLFVQDADDGQEAMRASQIANGPVSAFVITFANGKTRSFSGYVKQFSESGAVDGVVEARAAIKISGVVTRA